MKEHIINMAKLSAKISLLSLIRWLTIVITGYLLSFVSIIGILYKNMNSDYSFWKSFISHPTSAFLFLLQLVCFIIYFILANKITIQSAIYLLWKNKAGDLITSNVKNLLDKIVNKQPKFVSKAVNGSVLKLQLLQENKKNKDNPRLIRIVISYILNKINLEDINLQNKNDWTSIISFKLNNAISENIKPSLFFFWMLLLIQFLGLFYIFFIFK